MSITLPSSLLNRFRYNYFVETGSFRGEGINKALQAGFPNIYSIEFENHYYIECLNLYRFNNKIKLYKGDSGKLLFEIISNINERICFWLDAHSPTESPILDELEQIKLHPIKTHTILIDDIKLFGDRSGFKNITVEQIKEKLLEINPEYKIEFVDSLLIKEGILVAYVI